MTEELFFNYDHEEDVLHINRCPAYEGQELREMGGHVTARLNPRTSEIENLDVLFFSERLFQNKLFKLPVTAAFQAAGGQ